MFVKYGEEYAQLAELLGDAAEAARARKEVAVIYDAVLRDGWDGDWFVRAYDAHSHKVGSKECEEGQIYIEPQGFCVLAGIGVKEGLAQKALNAVKEHLDTKYGIMILQPAYTKYHVELGEISSYPPGYKENAGILDLPENLSRLRGRNQRNPQDRTLCILTDGRRTRRQVSRRSQKQLAHWHCRMDICQYLTVYPWRVSNTQRTPNRPLCTCGIR